MRRNIGIVQQDIYLFNDSMKENIRYGKLDATDEEIELAAKRANIHDYIMSLPNGYDTNIGERGVRLSGGQKQRLSIARVFLKNPPILILDEATSALDNTTEILIQKALDELCRGQHIGRQLYEYVLQFARESGCYNVTLNVWSCNPSAIQFYESCGLVPQKIGMEKIL